MRLLITAAFGLAAFAMAHANGIPIWRNWPVGDATDIGLLVALAVSLCLPRPATQPKDNSHG